MASKPLQRPLKPAAKAEAGAVKLAPLGALGPLPAEGQPLPIFATLDGAPVAVLPLDDYWRLVRAAMDTSRVIAPRAGRGTADATARRSVSTVERDPEVADFLRGLFPQHRTVAQLRAACIERFGEARAPSLTRITIFRQRTR